MKYFYLVNEISNRSFAHRNRPTMDEINKAAQHGYTWITEEAAIERKLEIPNDSEHYGVITQSRTWVVPTRIKDKAILMFWRNKWRAIRAYNTKDKTPSVKIMLQVEKTFRLNAGIPINHDVHCNWNYKFEMHDECCNCCIICDYANGCDSWGLF
jgi:hypothetical protein